MQGVHRDTRTGTNERATDNGWLTRPVQRTLDDYIENLQQRQGRPCNNTADLNTPWGDCDPNEEGPGPRLLQSLRWDDYDICIIQEPYINHRGKTRANHQWITVYLNTHQEYPDKTRSVILVNTNLWTDAWKQVHFQHLDITAIEITGNFGTLQIINVYNNGNNNNVLTHILAFMWDQDRQ
jgi:hypothetical protein